MPEEPIYGPVEDLDPRPLIKRESAKNTARINLRISPRELKEIDAVAKTKGLSRSELLRGVVAGITIKTKELTADEKQRTMAIFRASNNLNQIAKHVNKRPDLAGKSYVLEELRSLLEELRRLR